MLDKDLLECCQSILDFLCEPAATLISIDAFPTPKQKIMDEVLTRNGWGKGNGDMIDFTEYLNNLFQIGYQIKDESGSYRPFFSSEQSRNFYKHFIRKLKIKQLV